MLRLGFAWAQPGRHAASRLATTASLFSQLTLPPDPSIVFFGAEAGWEALILRALFGEEGQLLLIDDDSAAYDRYRHAPAELRITVPGAQQRQLMLRRDHPRIEYARADFFDYEPSRRYDVGIDWGLLEHFDDPGKQRVLRRFQRFLVPGGMQVTSTPRDRLAVRLFYRAFADELNFGYRELLSASELKGHVQRAGFVVERAVNFLGHVVVVSRMPA